MTLFSATKLRRFLFLLQLWLDAKLIPFQLSKKADMARLKRLLCTAPFLAPPETLHPQELIRHVKRVTHHPWLMRDRRCLRQGVLAYRYLAALGHDPEIHFGIKPSSLHEGITVAHCWVTINDLPVMNDKWDGMQTLLTINRNQLNNGIKP